MGKLFTRARCGDSQLRQLSHSNISITQAFENVNPLSENILTMAQLQPISEKQARVTVSALPAIFWTSIDGGDYTTDQVEYNDGNQGITKQFQGFTKIENVTLTKPYDPVNDGAITTFLASQRSKPTPFNVTVQPLNADVAGSAMAGAKAITYPNCSFVSYKPPKFDRNGNGSSVAMVELVIAVNGFPSY